jgi:hypothetical protein
MVKKYGNVVDAAKAIERPGIASIAMKTDPKLLKKGRNSKLPLPDRFNGLKKVTYGTYPMGYEYFAEDKGVGKQLTASGSTPDAFQVEKASGMHKASDNGIVYESDKDSSQKYIRIYKQNGKLKANTRHVYMNSKGDIVNITQEDFQDYFPIVSAPKKQLEAGVDEDKVVLPLSPKAENITYLKKGDIVFGEEDETMKNIIALMADLLGTK